jgi:hypothetical protein
VCYPSGQKVSLTSREKITYASVEKGSCILGENVSFICVIRKSKQKSGEKVDYTSREKVNCAAV